MVNVRALAGSIRRGAKVWLFASVVVVITLALSHDSRPVSASHTDIFFTQSTTSPSPQTSLLLFVNGGPVTLHVWARNVHDTLPRLGAFEVDIQYVSWLVAVNFIEEDSVWLGSTGRTVGCSTAILEPNLDTGGGHANVSCNTFGPSPAGPYGDGRLATLTVQPGAVPAITTLYFTSGPGGTMLIDTGQVVGGQVINPAVIPTTLRSLLVVMSRCADVNGDNFVSVTDIFTVAMAFGMTSSSPDWNPLYDLNDDGSVSVPDIFSAASQFGISCG